MFFFLPRTSLFVPCMVSSLFFVNFLFILCPIFSTSALVCLERLVSEMTRLLCRVHTTHASVVWTRVIYAMSRSNCGRKCGRELFSKLPVSDIVPQPLPSWSTSAQSSSSQPDVRKCIGTRVDCQTPPSCPSWCRRGQTRTTWRSRPPSTA